MPFRRITNRVWREKSRVTRVGGVSYVRGRDVKLEAKTSNQFVVFCKHLGRAHEKKNIPIFAPSKCMGFKNLQLIFGLNLSPFLPEFSPTFLCQSSGKNAVNKLLP